MTNAEMQAYRQVLIEQEKSQFGWQTSRFGETYEPELTESNFKNDINSKINAKANEEYKKAGAARKGSRVGYDSLEAKAKRKGIHDVHSGRLTVESIAVMPTPELYVNAWRTKGELSPAEKMGQEMQAGKEYSPKEH